MAAGEPRAINRWDTCGEAWIAALRHVWSAGEAGLDERGLIIEGPPLLFEIAALSWDDPVLYEHARVDPATQAVARGDHEGRMREGQNAEQLRWVADLLRARPWTTNAWISLTLDDDEVNPCLVALSFRIRAYRLIMTAMFRAHDVFRGYQAYIPLRGVQLWVADELGLPTGPLRVYVDVPHVHVADAGRVATILAAHPAPNAA